MLYIIYTVGRTDDKRGVMDMRKYTVMVIIVMRLLLIDFL